MLCSPEWLQEHLEDPSVRVFDCTVEMRPRPVGRSLLISGEDGWAQAHIPGSRYLSMPDELSSPTETILFGLPPAEHVQQVMRAHGVNEQDTIILYGQGYPGPVVRTWWVLVSSGARDVRVLDGGLEGWSAAGFALTDRREPAPSAGNFTAKPRPELRADAEAVAAALHDPEVVLVNALSPEQFAGTGGAHYGRPGRIPGSVSVPFQSLLRPGTSWFRSTDEIRAILQEAGVLDHARIISYCGGGIAASGTTFALHLIGRTDASLYDGSLAEWSADPSRPMMTGAGY
jgi:Rhodanese-related sulfurtransferase